MNYKFEMTEQEAQIMFTGLGELRATVVNPLINKLSTQFQEQQKSVEVKKAK
jgi:hypothetical protein